MTDQTEVEGPEGRHDHYVGRAGDGDQEGEEGPCQGQPVQQTVNQ